ncbi:MAG TPA: phosphatase PAP2 family protein [Thermoanaerobaculia bacterium]|jgi:membrane-associated phospholipid phosphatase|nr:phosphatase PAP2 family protein [Thermoanaerobaculia bacterium]
MTTLDHVVNLSLAIVLIVGAYQFYFWCQRQTQARARFFSFRLDNTIRLRPSWVWIYSGLYYPAILIVVTSVKDLRHFNYMAFSYLVLLGIHILVFLVFPVEVPPDWRQYRASARTYSQKLLAFVQKFDATSNCFPSLHVSVATLTALHAPTGIPGGFAMPALFVVLIAASCIFTKQHYLVDIPGGLVLGWISFHLFANLL